MASKLVEQYAALGRAFASLKARWFVFGGQAAILHGAVRFTEDIDVTVDAMGLETTELVAALEREGFELRVTRDVERFVEQTRVLPMFHPGASMPVDVVLGGPGIEELFFEGVVTVQVEGVCIPVAAAEDVVVMKLLAARPKDLEDVVAVLAARGQEVDLPRIRDLLRMLEQALGQSDLVPALEAALARAGRANR